MILKKNFSPVKNFSYVYREITDVPMTSICNSIERDLKEMQEETNLPEEILPVHGYLF